MLFVTCYRMHTSAIVTMLLIFFILLFVVLMIYAEMNSVRCQTPYDFYTNRMFYRTYMGLTKVPDDIPAEARAVYLLGNIIERLEKNSFSHLSQCVKLNLYHNKISVIELGAFNGLQSLTNLDLHYNELTTLKTNLFLSLRQCDYLLLSSNKISSIEDGAFHGLGNLKYLDLQYNKLRELRSEMFTGLVSLQKLLLNDNQLTTLNTSIFKHLPRPLILTLGNTPNSNPDNPFHCDASLCWLIQEERHDIIKWRSFGQNKPKCVNEIDWDNLNCTMTGILYCVNI